MKLSPNVLIIGAVGALILFQTLTKFLPGGSALKRQKPGVTRGDLVLLEEDLPLELAGWSRTQFVPAPSPESLPAGQYWWVHHWQFQKNGTEAIVSFDQLGEDQWHELTFCYRNLGWEIQNRTRYEDAEGGGSYVVAELRKDANEVALLVFSVFFENGAWGTPPSVDLPRLNQGTHPSGFLAKAKGRVNPIAAFENLTPGHTRALQCQVVVTNPHSDLAPELNSAILLHLETRQRFRSHWLRTRLTPQAHPKSTKTLP